MTLVWCIATKDEAVFFADSAKYYYTHREHHSWNTYEDFERDVKEKLTLDYEGKWFCMNKNLVFFIGDYSLRDIILKKRNIKEPSELATAIQDVMKEDGICSFSNAIICGFATVSNEIELHTINKGEPAQLQMPNSAIAFPSPEPMKMVRRYLQVNDFSDIDFNSINPSLIPHKMYERLIKNFLKDGNKIFNEINQKYPLILKPLHIAKLNRDGFVWLQHENKTQNELYQKGLVNLVKK
jgi:hypothetical protein